MIGGSLGYAVERFPISAMARSAVAMVLAWHVGLLLVSFVMLMRSPYASDMGVVPVGLGAALLTTVAAALAGVILHAAVSWLGLGVSPEWLRHLPVFIGMAGFLAGSIHAAVVCGFDDWSS